MSLAHPNHATYPDIMEAEFLLRMPADMHTAVRDRAAREGISMAECIRRAIGGMLETSDRKEG